MVSTAIIVGGAAIFVLALRRQYSTAALVFLAALFGSIFNFVDFLVNPPWMPMLLAFFAAGGRKAACNQDSPSVCWGLVRGLFVHLDIKVAIRLRHRAIVRHPDRRF